MDFIKKFIPNVVIGEGSHNLGSESFHCGIWKIYPFATYKGQDVSVLVLQEDPSLTIDLARNYLKRLKSFKHPNILKYIADDEPSVGSTSPKSFRIYVERIQQVPWIEISENSLWKEWFALGLVNAVNFCTHEARLIHSNIPNSVLMAADGGARLSGFEVAAPREESGYLIDIANRQACSDWFHPFDDNEGLKRLLSKLSLTSQPSVKTTRLDQVSSELLTLPVRSQTDKDIFFRRLAQEIPSFPPLFVENKIIPALLPFFVHSGPSVDLANLFLATNDPRTLDALIACPEKVVRIMLLDNISRFLQFLSEKSISQIIGSLSDSMPAVRDATIKASLSLFPKMNPKQAQETAREYIRLCSDDQPPIRTNSLICLGKIDSKNVPRESLVKTLASVSLRDPFVPARKMALTVVKAHQSIFKPEDLFHFLIPAISPLVIDKSDADIPVQALSLLKSFIKNNAPKGPLIPAEVNPSEKIEVVEKKANIEFTIKKSGKSSTSNDSIAEKTENKAKPSGDDDSLASSTSRKMRLGASKALNS